MAENKFTANRSDFLMQIILQKDVPNLGKKGELKDVAPGYARNHLLPRGLAVQATPQRLRELKQRQEKQELINQQLEEQARAQAEKLNQVKLDFKMPAGEGGRLFGSVTPADVSEKLSEKGFEIDKKDIDVDQPIKSLGDHSAVIKLHPGIKAEISISVDKDA